MDHSELGENFQNFRFKFIEPHEHDAVLEVLEKHLYYANAPIGYVPEVASDWNRFFLEMMKRGHNLSYMAVDTETGEIAACRMVDLSRKDVPPPPPPFEFSVNIDSFQACGDLCKPHNLFEKYNVTDIPDMFGLCVNDKYRQRGLATEMYTRGLNFLKTRGYKIVKCGFISPYSRKAGLKHGYKEYARKEFLTFRDKDGNILNPNADSGPDGFICFGIFDLRD